MENKINLDRPVIVEGRYDKNKLSSIINAEIITTNGFGIFRENEKKLLIRRLAEKNGIFVLTDSDSAGLLIRNYFNSILPKNKLTHIYIPEIKGKEKRKKAESKEGLLGVEGISAEVLRNVFAPFAAEGSCPEKQKLKKSDLYADGLLGTDGSAKRRAEFLKKAGLPSNLSSNALLEAINLLYSFDEYKELLK
ncbi:MAG: DUF4093 domain-containing protein [Firmicutes bacterium]|nr:DUF4093 domain-containing protein [Bacillota bacterium]